MSTRPNWKHQFIITKLASLFLEPVEQLGGVALTEPGIVWSEEAEDSVIPDLVVILADRLGLLSGNRLAGTPNLVIEVVSPGQADRDYYTKRELYQRTGAQEYWVVDDQPRTVTVHIFNGKTGTYQTYGENDTIRTGLVPGTEVKVADLFRWHDKPAGGEHGAENE